MAEKEATVYVVDVGKSMGNKNGGRRQTDLEWAMIYVWDKITSAVATDRKTLLQGVIALRTSGTKNELASDDAYHNITVLHELEQMLLPGLKQLQQLIVPSNTDRGDALSALVVAIQMISKKCKKLKYRRRIVLITNASGSIDTNDAPQIVEKLVEDEIQLVILQVPKERLREGVDFDDLEYGYKEEDKDPEKALNERNLKRIADQADGVFGTLKQAVEELGEPRIKETKPVASYKGRLTIGNPEAYDVALVIDVERYPRTMIRRPATASSFVQRSDMSNGHKGVQSSDRVMEDANREEEPSKVDPNDLAVVRNAVTYQVEDLTAPGGRRDVTREELARGFEYGRTAVHINESDEGITKLETKAALEILGFIPWAKHERYMGLSTSNVIVAQQTNLKGVMAMSSLIRALYELQAYAVARLVAKADKTPVLVMLAPSIEPDFECLIDVQLPFAEDFRPYRFAPLDRVVTVSGKVLKEHQNLPNDTLSIAMSDYVDRMDLSTFGQDDEGKPAEYMTMQDTYSPVLHRIDQAVRWRAVHPSEPVPPPYEILTRYMNPPAELQENSKKELSKLVAAAGVKKVPPKVKGRKRVRDNVKPLSGLDVDALLGPETRLKVSSDNTIPSFKRMLDATTDPNGIHDAAAQMGAIIEHQITNSFGDAAYGQAVEELSVLREEMIEMEEPAIWNSYIKALKSKILEGKLGGDRGEMWYEMRANRLGLVEGALPGGGEVTAEEARQFLSSK